jgi:hypothetical protein
VIPLLRAPLIYNKPVVPGSASYTTPGTYSLIVPNHNSMTFDSRGGGAGGGGPGGIVSGSYQSGGNGGGGGNSQVYYSPDSGQLNVIGYGGGGGEGLHFNGSAWVASNGSVGAGSGGDSNITGGGAGGGARGNMYNSAAGTYVYAGYGGAGGRAVRSVNRGILVPGQNLVIIVGGRGGPGSTASNNTPQIVQTAAGYGNYGAVYISWA